MSQKCILVGLSGPRCPHLVRYASASCARIQPFYKNTHSSNVKSTKTKKIKRIRTLHNLFSITLHTAYQPLNVIAFQLGAGTN